MTEDEQIIANHILRLVAQRYVSQIARLQQLLGVEDHFEARVEELIKKANDP